DRTEPASRGDSDCAISSLVRASPSARLRSAFAAYRAPSAAHATSVFRTWITRPSCRTARNSATRTTDTRVNWTTADPRSPSARALTHDCLQCLLEDVTEVRLGEGPQDGHDPRRHDRD